MSGVPAVRKRCRPAPGSVREVCSPAWMEQREERGRLGGRLGIPGLLVCVRGC